VQRSHIFVVIFAKNHGWPRNWERDVLRPLLFWSFCLK